MAEIFLRLKAGQQSLQSGSNIITRSFQSIELSPTPCVESTSMDYGQKLYDAVLRNTFVEPTIANHLPVTLRVTDADHHIWEWLHDGASFLALSQAAILRRLAATSPTTSLTIERLPLRILVTPITDDTGLTRPQANEIEATFHQLV